MPRRRRVGPAHVTCPLCGLDYEPGGDTCREHGCPIAFGGCATQHCPRCGYTMPDEERSAAARLVRRLFRAPRRRHAAFTLADLPAGAFGVIERLEGDPGLLARLTAQGLAPGVAIHVLQRMPTYVIEVGETTIALERRVAEPSFVRISIAARGVGDGVPRPADCSASALLGGRGGCLERRPPSASRSSTASGSRVTKPSP